MHRAWQELKKAFSHRDALIPPPDDQDEERNHNGGKFSQAYLRDMVSSKKVHEDQHAHYNRLIEADLDDYFVFEPKRVYTRLSIFSPPFALILQFFTPILYPKTLP